MNSRHEYSEVSDPVPGESTIPLLHGPLTKDEQRIIDEKRERAEEKKADKAYKKRQLSLSRSANMLTTSNVRLTYVLAGLTAVGAAAGWVQGCASIRSANAAKDAVGIAQQTLCEMQKNNRAQEIANKAVRKDRLTLFCFVVDPDFMGASLCDKKYHYNQAD